MKLWHIAKDIHLLNFTSFQTSVRVTYYDIEAKNMIAWYHALHSSTARPFTGCESRKWSCYGNLKGNVFELEFEHSLRVSSELRYMMQDEWIIIDGDPGGK